MSCVQFLEAMGLDADKFALVIYQQSGEADKEWQSWAAKHKGTSKAKFWRHQFYELMGRSIRRA